MLTLSTRTRMRKSELVSVSTLASIIHVHVCMCTVNTRKVQEIIHFDLLHSMSCVHVHVCMCTVNTRKVQEIMHFGYIVCHGTFAFGSGTFATRAHPDKLGGADVCS